VSEVTGCELDNRSSISSKSIAFRLILFSYSYALCTWALACVKQWQRESNISHLQLVLRKTMHIVVRLRGLMFRHEENV
jgi:hypothetical protein